MNSLKKVNKIYNEEIYKDIMNMPNNKKNKKENNDDNFWDIYQSDGEELSNNLNLSGSSKNNVFNNCQLLIGTTIPVDPGEEGSQSQAESKRGLFEDVDNTMNSSWHNYNVWGE